MNDDVSAVDALAVEQRERVHDEHAAHADFELADSPAAQLVNRTGIARDLRIDQQVDRMVGGSVIGVNLTLISDHDRDLDPREVKEMATLFITPPSTAAGLGFEQARERLLADKGRVVVIVGEEGTGRVTAAKALLASAIDKRTASCALLPLGGANHFPQRRLAAKQRCALLLNLPTDEEDFRISPRFGADLTSAVPLLRANDCYLVIITTPEQWLRISFGAPEAVAWYSVKADPLEIARSWLTHDVAAATIKRWTSDARIKELLKDQSPQDAVEIAALIRQAAAAPANTLDAVEPSTEDIDRAGAQPADTDFNRRVMSVVAARSNWHRQLLDWHTQPNRTALERNFMLAVAALPADTHVSEAYERALALCTRFGESLRASKGQQGPGVIAMAQAIGADLGDDRTITFKRPGWANAVFRYFWIDRPELTNAFIDWLAKIPLEAKSRRRSQLAAHIGEQVIRLAAVQHELSPLTSLLKKWSADKELWGVAAELTASATGTAALAPLMHSELLAWSKSGDKALRRLVVDVCASRYGSTYPEKALVRLNHAAADDDDRALDDAVMRAIDGLWQIPSMQAIVFKRLTGWTKLTDSRAGKARRTFARLAERPIPGGTSPQLLAPGADGDVLDTDDLVQAWRSLLHHNPDHAANAISRWLDTAAAIPDTKDLIFKILRTAVDVRNHSAGRRALNNLHLLVRDWERERRASADFIVSTRLAKDLVDLLDGDWKSYRLLHHQAYTTTKNGGGES